MQVNYQSNHSSLIQITPPSVEPVSLDEVKLFIKQDSVDDDSLLNILIPAARDYCEIFTNRKFIKQTWELGLDHFPNVCSASNNDKFNHWNQHNTIFNIEYLPINPVISINNIKYQDLANNQQTLSASVYQLDNRSTRARLTNKFNQSFPNTCPTINSVIINFDVGYGIDATFVPEGIKTAILMTVCNLYDNRNPNSGIQTYPIDLIEKLLWRFKIASY